MLEDTDVLSDVYQRSGSATTLISAGTSDGLHGASFAGASADGTHVFFTTDDKLVGADTDSSDDLYERSAVRQR